ncbi:uncharacterized protein LOC106157612 isoform X2 [Lingula anatina]|uniref:Uncharacterized protein LOC106157612 isoform X2 n=1 Tax=Lingula anatina TaxID=7574 RepID=A0A1S3HUP8_LINAN|nr:uncharacterized protein LOC106157612 isoform X2 [Lingula anatina]|eukprot:XP_013388784.1 uncharacterized protein LOC106157612 isoform X2 [Lingula anatina]
MFTCIKDMPLQVQSDLSTRQLETLLQNLDRTSAHVRAFLAPTDGHMRQEEPRRRRRRKICPAWWPCKCKLPKTLYKYMLVFTFILQLFNIVALTVLDAIPKSDQSRIETIVVSAIIMITLHLVNLVIVIMSTIKLSRQVYWHNVSKTFFLQNYLATVLLFSGIYSMTYRIDNNGWASVSLNLNDEPKMGFLLYFEMMTLSISTATLCGASTITPKHWYNSLILCVQMLLSYMYFASLMSMGSESGDQAPPAPPSREEEDEESGRRLTHRAENGGSEYQRI